MRAGNVKGSGGKTAAMEKLLIPFAFSRRCRAGFLMDESSYWLLAGTRSIIRLIDLKSNCTLVKTGEE